MTTPFGPISEPETDPFAPLKSSLFKRLVNNLVAALDGATGAPRLALGALSRIDVGTTVRHTSTKSESLEDTAVSVSWFFPFVQGGSARFTLTLTAGSDSSVVRRRGGVDTVLGSGTGDYDVAILPGDVVLISVSDAGVGTNTATATVDVKTGDADIIPVGGDFFGNYSGNALL